MMNLESLIDEKLWNSIRNHYTSRDFTNSIIDAMSYLSHLIREKSGLDNDGVNLVGSAFGGKNPKLKVNKLRTISERDEQKGIDQLLRGLYTYVRNPRIHEKIDDCKEDADSIIVFINYTAKIIDKSKSQFNRNTFVNRVFDSNFVNNPRYSKLLVEEIPDKQLEDIFITIYREKTRGDIYNLQCFFSSLINRISNEEKSNLIKMISEELKETDDKETIKYVTYIFPLDFWKEYDEISRIRVENIFIESIKDGTYDKSSKKCSAGALGTWCTERIVYFELKNELANVLCSKLQSENQFEEDYVFQYFFKYFPKISDPPTMSMIITIQHGLHNGDERYFNAYKSIKSSLSDDWITEFTDDFDNFVKKEQAYETELDDDLPF